MVVDYQPAVTVSVIPPREINLRNYVSKGYYSNVIKGTWGNFVVAVKRYKPHVDEDQAQVELARLAQVNHENVVRFLGVTYENNNSYPSLVMEWVPFGKVTSYLFRSREKGLRGEKMIFISRGIGCGMSYLHSRNIVHGDLATRNCFIGPGLHVKIGDLGHYDSRCDGQGVPAVFKRDPTRLPTFFMPTAWWAPENVPFASKKGSRSAKGDVWSFGCVLFEIWTLGGAPFHRLWRADRSRPLPEDPKKLEEIIFKQHNHVHSVIQKGGKPWDYRRVNVRAPVRHLMSMCWEYDPNGRPDFCEITGRLSDLLN